MSDTPKKDTIDAPPATIQFRTSGQAGYGSTEKTTAATVAVSAPRPEAQRTDNCRFRPAGC